MRRNAPKEGFCWVVPPDEGPVALDQEERPILPVSGGDEATASEVGGRRRVPLHHRGAALAFACVVAFAVGWTLAGTAGAETRVSDLDTAGDRFRPERLVVSIDRTNAVAQRQRSKGAST